MLPLAQVVYAYLPRTYADSAAVAGLDMVENLQWLYITAALDTWANASSFIRTAQLPTLQSALMTALETVTSQGHNAA